jgi:hypothetical protein
MNAIERIQQGDFNASRMKAALERQEFLRDHDEMVKLTHPNTLRKWQLTVPDESWHKFLKVDWEEWKKLAEYE